MKKTALSFLSIILAFSAPSFAAGTAGGAAASSAAAGGVSATTISMGAGALAVGIVAVDASKETTTGTVGTITSTVAK